MSARFSALEPMEEDEPAPRPRRWPILLSALVAAGALAFQVFLLSDWIGREARPPSWDQAIHLETAQDYADHLARGDWGGLLHLAPKPGMPPFPPLFYLTLQPAMRAAEPVTAALWANAGWLALLTAATWGLALLFAGPWEAAVAAILLACAPQTQWLLRNQLPDLALAAAVASAYLTFSASAGFMRWPGAVAFGAAAGGAMLVKWSAWTYFLPLAWILLCALRDRLTRWRAAAALGAAALVCAPWYLAQLPVLAPRLAQAASDQAVPVWRGWAALSYVWILLGGLDTPLWALALVAAVAPRLRKGRDDGWALAAWFVSSFVFWTIVPNRQMRFLYPALAPLMILVPGIFPKVLAGAACAWQLFSAANYTHAWVKPFDLRVGQALPFLSSEPPAREDWKVAQILKAADARVEGDRPFVNLTLLANAERFNGPVFNWVRKRERADRVRVRGVNRRVCELSEFVVIKQGSLGPASVVNQLPEVRDALLEPDSWFLRGYTLASRFPLAEGEALLYQRRRSAAPPFKARELRFDNLETSQYAARGLVVRFGPWDPKRGVYESAELDAQALSVRGLEIHGLKARLEGLDLVPVGPPGRVDDVRLLRLDGLTLESADLSSESVAAFLAQRVPALSQLSVALDGTVRVAGTLRDRLPLAAEASLGLGSDGLDARLLRASLGPAPIPFADRASYRLSFAPNPEMPFTLKLAGLSLSKGRLSIP